MFTGPQWQRHEVVNGRCRYCHCPFAYEGIVCFKSDENPDNVMTTIGDLPWAKDCTERPSA